ncbi:bifunctional diguanylate cyclase/phosphodiesterase [Paenibacillus sp. BC26]|uniref:bifunctional diguanylate cyclase/phosphodiesterase n=1 Tax=Paenibacillus sp. BC26 TaxID=1881032 RepID=UPI0008EEA68D|nr:bifunctional diguanylate cyclase/phosphodiesterase [Paenibacillus sp. BC26]SFS57513.1 diguanylate cyclase (GGDEF) domain-containing protein [Paenibacillus sp. BC26]
MQGHYNIWIVLLSFAIAVMASYSALNLAGKITRSSGRTRTIWLIAGSVVMGMGVWSMHFVGMLAYHMDTTVTYDTTTTILSSLGSILASFIAFRITARSQSSPLRYALGGLIMGCGIVAMHYTGMSAMRMPGQITYDVPLWLLSAFIALAASYAALYLFHKLRYSPDFTLWKLISAIVMGIAICGMHYTGMAAAKFTSSGEIHHAMGSGEPQFFLLFGVTVSTFFILAVSWGAVFFDRHVLEKMAYYDQLTNLPNRHDLQRFFNEKNDRLEQGAFLFIDLDRFKMINDTLGHDVGDMLLQQVADRLRLCATDGELIFRLGGDEFLVVARTSEIAVLEQLAHNLLNQIKQAYFIEAHELYVTCSIGISHAPYHGVDRSSLLKAADTAMYAAKVDGKNRFRIFDEEMSRNQIRKLVLEKDMRKAMVHGEFTIMYQPKWDTGSDQLSGMEALMRWQHPELGSVSPSEFIAVAEETGMIIPMTRWMLQEVCKQNKYWQENDNIHTCISVNMSIRIFESQLLFEMVDEALRISGLPGHYLELEITESIAKSDVNDIIEQLRSIRDLAVKVSLDDFGTGYSSLGTLDELPVDTLKIDQIFIHKSAQLSKQAIISNIIAIAKNLNLEVVAEGVETQDQIDILQSRGCHVMQGFYYSKPMTARDMTAWLEQKQQAVTV